MIVLTQIYTLPACVRATTLWLPVASIVSRFPDLPGAARHEGRQTTNCMRQDKVEDSRGRQESAARITKKLIESTLHTAVSSLEDLAAKEALIARSYFNICLS